MGFLTKAKLLFILFAAYSLALLICASLGLHSSVRFRNQMAGHDNNTNGTFGPQSNTTNPDHYVTRGSNVEGTYAPGFSDTFELARRNKRQAGDEASTEPPPPGEASSEATVAPVDGDESTTTTEASPAGSDVTTEESSSTTISTLGTQYTGTPATAFEVYTGPTKPSYVPIESLSLAAENHRILVGSAIELVASIFGLITCVFVLFINRKKPDIFMSLILAVLLLVTFIIGIIGYSIFLSSEIRTAQNGDKELYGPGWNGRMTALQFFGMLLILHVSLAAGYIQGKTDQNKKGDKGNAGGAGGSPGPAAPAKSKSSPSTAAQP